MTDARGVESARPGDGPALAGLSARCLGLEAWSASAFEAEIARSSAHVRLVRGPGARILAFLAGRASPDGFEILSLATAPERRREGLAAALVADAAQGSRGRPLRLEVRSGNAAGRAFYAAQGFSPQGERPGVYRDGEAAAVLERPGDAETPA